MITQSSNTIIELTIPTIFPELNVKEGQEENYERTTLHISRLKFKHLKKMQSMPESEQMLFALSMLTGLSESDLDELDAVDSANVMAVVYGFMENFFKLAGRIANSGQ